MMKAFVLAAGLGSRLRPLTLDTPKPLLRIGTTALIDLALFHLREAGIREVGINLHHLPDQIKGHLDTGRQFDLNLTFFEEEHLLGTGGALRNARSFLDGDAFFVLNSDIVCDVDLNDVLQFHLRSSAIATMVLTSVHGRPDPREVAVNSSGIVMSINNVPRIDAETPTFTFTGIQVLTQRVFDYLPSGPSSIIDKFYQAALDDGQLIAGFEHRGFWRDAGSMSELNALRSNPPSFLQR